MATGTLTRSSNPALSDKAIQRAATDLDTGWGAPSTAPGTAPGGLSPVSPVDTMTMRGVIWAAAALIVLVVAGAAVGWSGTEQTGFDDPTTGEYVSTTSMPGWTIATMLVGFGFALVTIFKPNFARITGPLYALCMGTVVGSISAVYNDVYPGIVLQAIMCTIGVFAIMLFLYGTRIIKVTNKLAIGIVAATGGIFLTYLASFIWMLFTNGTPAIFESGVIGIGFSVLVVGVAAFNLLLDFNFVERGVEAGLPKGMEWYAAFSLVVTLIWLYIEMLRLLGKLRG